MFCSKCGEKNNDGAKFCKSCGFSILSETNVLTPKKGQVIKCAGCEYEGEGKKGRRVISQILAWLVVPIFWPVTLAYYLITKKYLCPQCGSDFLAIKNKEGIYKAQRSGTSAIVWFLGVIIAIAIVGIMASVILASLNTARDKGDDATTKTVLSNLQIQAGIYLVENLSYSGFCSGIVAENISNTLSTDAQSEYRCDNGEYWWIATSKLSRGDYYCVDGNAQQITISRLAGGTSC